MVRTDLAATSQRVAEVSKPLYEVQDFTPESMKAYLEQDALLFPVDTIVEKAKQNDFDFFLA